MNAQAFFSHIRQSLFRGSLDQAQVDGCTAILAAWSALEPNGDVRHLAYSFATAFHETARAMQPVREIGLGRGKPYGHAEPPYNHVYYGRGLCQLTWIDNYRRASPLVDVDLVKDPEQALVSAVASKLLIRGLEQGLFTGASLSRYINSTSCDFYDARRTVNGTDCATEIAGYASKFLEALAA